MKKISNSQKQKTKPRKKNDKCLLEWEAYLQIWHKKNIKIKCPKKYKTNAKQNATKKQPKAMRQDKKQK